MDTGASKFKESQTCNTETSLKAHGVGYDHHFTRESSWRCDIHQAEISTDFRMILPHLWIEKWCVKFRQKIHSVAKNWERAVGMAMGKSTISMAIFHCYVSSPEDTLRCRQEWQGTILQKWRFLDGTITCRWENFQHAMLDYWILLVHQILIH